MNGPMKMYLTKQIVRHDFPVELPKCMYVMKNIHSGRNGVVDGSPDHVVAPKEKLDIFDQVKQFLKNNQQIPGMAELEAKQEDILRQLAELKNQILSIKSDLKITTNSTKTSAGSSSSSKFQSVIKREEQPSEIVINANPKYPPYSLEIVQRLLQDTVAMNITCFLHSTISSIPEEAKTLQHTLANFKSKDNVPKIDIRLIWKDVDTSSQLSVSFVPICGEVNVLRYIARAVPCSLTYDNDPECIEMESLLDLCHLLQRAKTKTERAAMLQTLNKSLGKSQWLLGRSKPSIVDIAACSAIRQVTASSEINVNMGKWLQRCLALAS